MSRVKDIVEKIRGGLIVSCQAGPDSPLHGPTFMAAMAQCAKIGGAVGIRANGPEDVGAIKRVVDLPLFDCHKRKYDESDVYIMPTRREAEASAKAGADVIVMDATPRQRPNGETLESLIKFVHDELGLPIMADISTREEGIRAYELGADFVATTLSGYTSYSRPASGPDIDLVQELASSLPVPIIAEGRYVTPALARKAIEAGATAVVVGTAITAPTIITKWFVAEIKQGIAH